MENLTKLSREMNVKIGNNYFTIRYSTQQASFHLKENKDFIINKGQIAMKE